jgi:hypothetical protein
VAACILDTQYVHVQQRIADTAPYAILNWEYDHTPQSALVSHKFAGLLDIGPESYSVLEASSDVFFAMIL